MGLTPRQTGILLARTYPNAHVEARLLGVDPLELAESKAAQLSDSELQAIIFDEKARYPEEFEC